MKKRLLSLLLAALMTLSVMLPLTVIVSAESIPHLRTLYEISGQPMWEDFAWDKVSISGVKTSYDAKNKVAFLHLENYVSTSTAFYAVLPSESWELWICVKGNNKLPVKLYKENKRYMAIGTNGRAMWIYPGASGDSLEINGTYGTASTPKELTNSYYALYSNSIMCGSESTTRLTLNINFDLNISTAHNSYEVYPFNEDTTLKEVSFNYSYKSTYECSHPEGAPITLDRATYFYTNYQSKQKNTHAFHSIIYGNNFSGLLHIDTVNGYYYGGPYSRESNVEALGLRYNTTIGATNHYHAVAKNCSFTLSLIEPARLKADFTLPLEYGYTLPDHLSGTGYDAKITWTEEGSTADLTGTKVEYGKKYTANIIIVPWGFHYLPSKDAMIAAFNNKTLIPSNAYSFGFVENKPFESGFYYRYNAVQKPALTITKQPVDYLGSDSDKQARFSVDSNDTTATYQWQISDNGTSGWKDLKDSYTSGGGIKIGGANTKNLTYNFNYEDLAADLKYFRCVVRSESQTVISSVAKYQYSAPVKTAIHHTSFSHLVPMVGDKLSGATYSSWLKDQFNVTETWQRLMKLVPETWSTVSSGSSFENGVYKVTFVLTPKTNFYLADDFSIDMMPSYKPVGGYKITVESNKVTVIATYNVHDYVSKLILGGNWTPVAGKGVNDSIPFANAYDDAGNIIGPGSAHTDKVVINQADCFWYEGASVKDPERLDINTDVFQDGKYYTFRFHVAPKSGITFRDDITFVHKDDPDDVTVTAYKLSDGSYNVDFTYSRLATVLGSIKLKYLDLPYGSVMLSQNEVRSMESDAYTAVKSTGWHKESFAIGITEPEVGNTYYCTVELRAAEGYRFTSSFDAIQLLTTSDGKNEIVYDSVEYKLATDKRENDTLLISLGAKCTENHLKDVVAYDYDSPKVGQKLDRTVSLEKENATVKFVDYTINGKPVTDYNKQTPAAGDVVCAYIGVSPAQSYIIDEYARMALFVDEDTPNEAIRKEWREFSYTDDPDVCVFMFSFDMPSDSNVIRNFTLYMEPPKDGQTLDHNRWCWGVGLIDQSVVFYIEGEQITNYDYVAKAGEEYEIYCYIEPDAGYTVADDAVMTWYAQGKELKGTRADEKVPPEAVGVSLFIFTYKVPGASSVKLGDVDGNGEINSADARLCLRRAVDLETYEKGSDKFIACDVDKNNEVTSADARKILRAAVELEDPSTW